ncbi:hypothetical protein CU098_010451, partial [Rhizopus stolonifer]
MTAFSNEWTLLEKLLLTQAVYKYGENMWFQVARVLKQHGLIQQQNLQRQPDFYSQKNCSFQYYLLVENMEAEKQMFRNDLTNDMPVVVRLARQLYIQRVEEIKQNLKKDQEEFSRLALEIDTIKAGEWDSTLKQRASDSTTAQTSKDDSNSEPVIESNSNDKNNNNKNSNSDNDDNNNNNNNDSDSDNSNNDSNSNNNDSCSHTSEAVSENNESIEYNKTVLENHTTESNANSLEKQQDENEPPRTTENPLKRTTDASLVDSSHTLKRCRLTILQDEDESLKELHVLSAAISNASSTKEKVVLNVDSPEITPVTVPSEDALVRTEQTTKTAQNQSTAKEAKTNHVSNILIPKEISSNTQQEPSASPKIKTSTPDEEYFQNETASTPTSVSKKPLNTTEQRQKAWQKNINLLWQEIANHKNGTMFMNPIKKSHAPLYDK